MSGTARPPAPRWLSVLILVICLTVGTTIVLIADGGHRLSALPLIIPVGQSIRDLLISRRRTPTMRKP